MISFYENGLAHANISFFSENSLELDALAKEKNITAIVDCGVAPGMDNVILGYYNEKMKLTDWVQIYWITKKYDNWLFLSPFLFPSKKEVASGF